MQETNVIHLRCTVCGKVYKEDEGRMVCPDHGQEGILDVEYDYAKIGDCLTKHDLVRCNDFSQWRYKALLPMAEDTVVPALSVGWTPLLKVDHLARKLGIAGLYLKDETRQATGSLKDRASAMAVVKAKEAGAKVLTTASTGNAAAALAGMCAASQMGCVIFVPATAPAAKISQLLAYGSQVNLVDGSYDEAFELCLQAADKFGWYNRNTGFNPYMTEGKKTCAFEICEQLDWQTPDQLFVSVGDGSIIGGLHKGLKDLFALGFIDKIPQLMGVQSEGSDYMWQADRAGTDIVQFPAINADTIADSIAAGLPRDRIKAAAAVKNTGGHWLRVSDESILMAIPELAAATGVFAEPAAAASYAGLKMAMEKGFTRVEQTVALVITGNGLKDVPASMEACTLSGRKATKIAPLIEKVKDFNPNAC